MYEKTSDKWKIPESDIKALMVFYNQYNYRLICEMMNKILDGFRGILENVKDIHEICRAQGAFDFYRQFQRGVELLVKDAKDEEDGVFGEGDTINVEEMINNAKT